MIEYQNKTHTQCKSVTHTAKMEIESKQCSYKELRNT